MTQTAGKSRISGGHGDTVKSKANAMKGEPQNSAMDNPASDENSLPNFHPS